MAGDRLDINVSVQGAEQAAAQIDRVNTSVDRNTEATKKSDAAAKVQTAGLAGTVGSLKKATAAYGQVLAIAAKVTAAISVANDVLKVGAAAWDLYGAKMQQAGTAQSMTESVFALGADLSKSLADLSTSGEITAEHAAEYRRQVDAAFTSWEKQSITVEDLWKRLHRVSQELIRMNKEADNSPLLMGSKEDTFKNYLEDDQTLLGMVLSKQGVSRLERSKLALENLQRQLNTISGYEDPETGKRVEGLMDVINRKRPENEKRTVPGSGVLLTQEYLDWYEDYNQALQKQIELTSQIEEIQNSMTFTGNLRSGLQELADEWGNLGKQMSDVMVNGVAASVKTVSDQIWQAIQGTATWGQAFLRVGQQIVQSLIQVAVQYVASQLIMMVIGKAFAASSTKVAGLAAKKLAAIWAPAATSASIASYGAASGIGFAAYAAAIASGTAMAGAFSAGGGAFQEGGFTGPGNPSTVAGIVHLNEFVIPAPIVQAFGVEHFQKYLQGGFQAGGLVQLGSISPILRNEFVMPSIEPVPHAAESPRVDRGGREGGSHVNVGILRTRQDLRDFAATEGARMIFDELGRRSNKFNV